MKDIINKKVKHREELKSFTPVVLYEKAKEYFEINEERLFMLRVGQVKKDKIKEIPNVTHVDGSARMQIVKKEQNLLFYNLIHEFERISKIPILLNTSFNMRDEPIVCSLENAYNCFINTQIDYFVLGSYLILKNNKRR